MNRIDKKIKEAASSGKKLLSPYITAGDPHPKYTVALMHQLVKEGADILEIGIPFSDPMAEGPVIQLAMERALAHGVTSEDVLDCILQFRKKDKDTPIVLMGYLNPIEQYGYEKFALAAKKAGVDGTIIVDLPPEESASIVKIWQNNNLYPIFLCSPTTSQERMKLLDQLGKGYLYYVSLKGVTGADSFDLNEVKIVYQKRKKQTKLPLLMGFGIKTAEMAAQAGQFADGIIVGAALVENIFSAYQQDKECTKALSLIGDMRKALDNRT